MTGLLLAGAAGVLLTGGWERLGCQYGPTPEARDACRERRVGRSETAPLAAAEARKIVDPVVRAVALLAWVQDHQGGITPVQANELCTILPKADRQACVRKASAAHLQR